MQPIKAPAITDALNNNYRYLLIWKNTNLPDKKRRKYAPIIPVNNPIELQGKNNREDKKGRENDEFGRVAVDKQPLPVHDPARTARQTVLATVFSDFKQAKI